MGNVVTSGEHRESEQFVEDYTASSSSRRQSGQTGDRQAGQTGDRQEEKRVRFQDHIDTDTAHNVVLVKGNENRSSASSSGYESKSCSSIDESDTDTQREANATILSPGIPNKAIEDILTCDECGQRFRKSGLYLAHIRTRSHFGCNSNVDHLDEKSIMKRAISQDYPSPKSLVKAQADAIRKTKSYNQERDLLWIAPEKLRPTSARPEHRMLGPLGNSYIHWLTHLERLERLSDDSSETEDRSPPSTGESTLC